MKKIIVFGASGATGLQVVQHALEAGHRVTAIVRNPTAFLLQHPKLFVVKGDVMVRETFSSAAHGQDIVISTLGSRGEKPVTVYSTGIKNIISTMQEHKIQRIVCLSAGALYTNARMGLFIRLVTKLVLQRILKEPYADMRLMETIIQGTNLDYTIIRPPRLTNKAMTRKYRSVVNDHLVRPFSIARADLAHYILNLMDDSRTFRSIAEISY
jgi:putative NADH-flavin reductase